MTESNKKLSEVVTIKPAYPECKITYMILEDGKQIFTEFKEYTEPFEVEFKCVIEYVVLTKEDKLIFKGLKVMNNLPNRPYTLEQPITKPTVIEIPKKDTTESILRLSTSSVSGSNDLGDNLSSVDLKPVTTQNKASEGYVKEENPMEISKEAKDTIAEQLAKIKENNKKPKENLFENMFNALTFGLFKRK